LNPRLTIKQEISPYYLDGDKINTDPDIVKEKVVEHYNLQFLKATASIKFNNQQISKALSQYGQKTISERLISKENTAPGLDQIPV
jgi:hypothetical protein